MAEWLLPPKYTARPRADSFIVEQHLILSNKHHWYPTSHARPTYCNVCREALPGVTSHGLSCEICKTKTHKNCAEKALPACKWTTLATVGRDIIEDGDGRIIMPHQWIEGNLPVSTTCAICKKMCGSVLRLQDWRCLWCRESVHTACRPLMAVECPIGISRLSVVPPTCIYSAGSDDSWDVVSPQGHFLPLLVFVNSKSGDNQGEKFLRRFKQILNPAQVFDLISTGPSLGLRLFRHFEAFRILICSGDGSIGWVLSEIDRFNMHKQCQVAVLPLGTGNDLARVLGWGSSCEDDAHLHQLLERYECASTKMLDRWSIMVFEKDLHSPKAMPKMTISRSQETLIAEMVTTAHELLHSIFQTDDKTLLMKFSKQLCRTMDQLLIQILRVREPDPQFIAKCDTLKQSCITLLTALRRELTTEQPGNSGLISNNKISSKSANDKNPKTSPVVSHSIKICGINEDFECASSKSLYREDIVIIATSIQRALNNVIEHSEPGRPKRYQRKLSITPLEFIDTTNYSKSSASYSSMSPNIPLVNIVSPSLGDSQIRCFSPTIDNLHSPTDQNFLGTITLKVPEQFADMRRSSGISEAIPEMEELPPFQETFDGQGEYASSLEVFLLNSGKGIDSTTRLVDIIQNLESNVLTHIDSPESCDETYTTAGENEVKVMSRKLETDEEAKSYLARMGDEPNVLSILEAGETGSVEFLSSRPPFSNEKCSDENMQLLGFENMILEIDNRSDDQKMSKPLHYDRLDKNTEGHNVEEIKVLKQRLSLATLTTTPTNAQLKCNIISVNSPLNLEEETQSKDVNPTSEKTVRFTADTNSSSYLLIKDEPNIDEPKHIYFDKPCKQTSCNDFETARNLVSNALHPIFFSSPKSPTYGSKIADGLRRQSSPAQTKMEGKIENDLERRYSAYNSALLSTEAQEEKIFKNASPAASRRISCGSLFKMNNILSTGQALKGPKMSLTRLSNSPYNPEYNALGQGEEVEEKGTSVEVTNKELPIINPLVQEPNFPNTLGTTGFISQCLLANADTLCAAVSPLMDPDSSLMAGYYEKCVMNNYFGIGIDAKISLDFHNKRLEHPEKCRSRARNYMWYGVLGSKQIFQRTCKNLEQRVQLECDGKRIHLPSLQGIVIMNIPSFMGGTNFWGSTGEDDVFLPQSFDDRILEVVAVFGSAQMAASRIINLQHHRIAQCQTIQINILGDEEIPIEVDGEAWLQAPGVIRILHKNRVQVLCRIRSLEVSLKSWQEKQRQLSLSIQRSRLSAKTENTDFADEFMSEREYYALLNFVESVSSLIKWVKFLIISHDWLQSDLYATARRASETLESIHPNGKLIKCPSLRTNLVDVIDSSRQLYDNACSLLREREHNYILREDLETKLSTSLACMEMELKKCTVQNCPDGKLRAYFKTLAPNEAIDGRQKSRPFWMRIRSGSTAGQNIHKSTHHNTHDAVSHWGVSEVATWLETMQMSDYVDNFIKNDIRGKELLTLGRRDLKDLGVIKVGHVKRILQAIKELSET